jgi:hypothetical protein
MVEQESKNILRTLHSLEKEKKSESKISRIIQPENCDDIIDKDKELIELRIKEIENDPQLSQEEKILFVKKLRIELGKVNNLIK